MPPAQIVILKYWLSNPNTGYPIQILAIQSKYCLSNPNTGYPIQILAIQTKYCLSNPNTGYPIQILAIQSKYWLSNPNTAYPIQILPIQSKYWLSNPNTAYPIQVLAIQSKYCLSLPLPPHAAARSQAHRPPRPPQPHRGALGAPPVLPELHSAPDWPRAAEAGPPQAPRDRRLRHPSHRCPARGPSLPLSRDSDGPSLPGPCGHWNGRAGPPAAPRGRGSLTTEHEYASTRSTRRLSEPFRAGTAGPGTRT